MQYIQFYSVDSRQKAVEFYFDLYKNTKGDAGKNYDDMMVKADFISFGASETICPVSSIAYVKEDIFKGSSFAINGRIPLITIELGLLDNSRLWLCGYGSISDFIDRVYTYEWVC